MKRINIFVTDEQYDQMKNMNQMSEFIRQAIQKALDEMGDESSKSLSERVKALESRVDVIEAQGRSR